MCVCGGGGGGGGGGRGRMPTSASDFSRFTIIPQSQDLPGIEHFHFPAWLNFTALV